MTTAGNAARRQLLVVTGLSGSGKSFVGRALEDVGFTTVDNLPLSLVVRLADEIAAGRTPGPKNAVVLDVRNPDFVESFPGLLDGLKQRLPTRVLFLDCEDRALLNRFSETRRPHPLALGRTLPEAVALERRLLSIVKERADIVLDTTDMTVHACGTNAVVTYPLPTLSGPCASNATIICTPPPGSTFPAFDESPQNLRQSWSAPKFSMIWNNCCGCSRKNGTGRLPCSVPSLPRRTTCGSRCSGSPSGCIPSSGLSRPSWVGARAT
jgi:hypothetical protein